MVLLTIYTKKQGRCDTQLLLAEPLIMIYIRKSYWSDRNTPRYHRSKEQEDKLYLLSLIAENINAVIYLI
jgi:hypothetical protein